MAQAAVLKSSAHEVEELDHELPEESGGDLGKLIRAIESRPLDLYRDTKVGFV